MRRGKKPKPDMERVLRLKKKGYKASKIAEMLNKPEVEVEALINEAKTKGLIRPESRGRRSLLNGTGNTKVEKVAEKYNEKKAKLKFEKTAEERLANRKIYENKIRQEIAQELKITSLKRVAHYIHLAREDGLIEAKTLICEEVAKRWNNGEEAKEIGEELGIQPSTIPSHLKHAERIGIKVIKRPRNRKRAGVKYKKIKIWEIAASKYKEKKAQDPLRKDKEIRAETRSELGKSRSSFNQYIFLARKEGLLEPKTPKEKVEKNKEKTSRPKKIIDSSISTSTSVNTKTTKKNTDIVSKKEKKSEKIEQELVKWPMALALHRKGEKFSFAPDIKITQADIAKLQPIEKIEDINIKTAPLLRAMAEKRRKEGLTNSQAKNEMNNRLKYINQYLRKL